VKSTLIRDQLRQPNWQVSVDRIPSVDRTCISRWASPMPGRRDTCPTTRTGTSTRPDQLAPNSLPIAQRRILAEKASKFYKFRVLENTGIRAGP
jgi:hypothetical protein